MGTQSMIRILFFVTLLKLQSTHLSIHNRYQKCPGLSYEGCRCSESSYIGHGIGILCSRVRGLSGLNDITSSLSLYKLSKSIFLSQDDLSYSRATTSFSFIFGDVRSIDEITFERMFNTRVLVLQHNKISYIHEDAFSKLKVLEALDLSHNKLTSITPTLFNSIHQLLNLSLAHNELTKLPFGIFNSTTLLSNVNIVGNDWYCDGNLVWLNDWLKTSGKRRLVDISKLRCGNSSEEEDVGKTLMTGLRNIKVRKFIKQSPTCYKLCNCYPKNGFPIVDCRNKGLTKIPESVPEHTRVVYLNNNQISVIQNSRVTSASWQDVNFLDLRNNSISSISSLEGTKLLRNLGALDVSQNDISYVPIHLLKQMEHIQVLKLSDNPWKCNCKTVVFQTWLQKQHSIVKDWDNVRCSKKSGPYKNKAIYTVQKTKLCVKEHQSIHYLDVLSIVMAILILLIVGRLIYDYWSQKRTGQLPTFSKLL